MCFVWYVPVPIYTSTLHSWSLFIVLLLPVRVSICYNFMFDMFLCIFIHPLYIHGHYSLSCSCSCLILKDSDHYSLLRLKHTISSGVFCMNSLPSVVFSFCLTSFNVSAFSPCPKLIWIKWKLKGVLCMYKDLSNGSFLYESCLTPSFSSCFLSSCFHLVVWAEVSAGCV